jgi:hypothetical protein
LNIVDRVAMGFVQFAVLAGLPLAALTVALGV